MGLMVRDGLMVIVRTPNRTPVLFQSLTDTHLKNIVPATRALPKA